MIALSYKSTHYATIALKVLVLGLTGWYLAHTFGQLSSLSWQEFRAQWAMLPSGLLMGIGFLSLLNWGLEFRKWQSLASLLRPLNFLEAAKQSLISFSLSITTPNRLGEYPVKALFYRKAAFKKVLWLNLAGNLAQLLTTLLFGLLGLAYWSTTLPIDNLALAAILLVVIVGIGVSTYLLRNDKIRSLRHLIQRPGRLFKVFMLALARYGCFGLAFVLLLSSLSGQAITLDILALTGCYYLLVSIIPTWLVLDVMVKGGTAVWLFSWLGLDPLSVITAVLLMWLFNYLLPALAGAGLFGLHPLGRYD